MTSSCNSYHKYPKRRISKMTAAEIILSLPERFIPAKAQNISAIVHLDIAGEAGGPFTLEIKNGACTVKAGLHGKPTAVLWADDKTYVDIETGKKNPMMAMARGRLKVSNIAEVSRVIDYFTRLT
jgi:putative sterol carrier protein